MEATIVHALPQSCFLPGGVIMLIRMEMLPKLKAVMSDEEIVAASKGQQPRLDQMRAITCRGCAEVRCPLNFQYRPSGGLGDLMNGQYAERIEKGNELLARLLPEAKKAELERDGIKVVAIQMISRKNPKLIFWFTRGDRTQRVSCEVGRRRLRTNEGEEDLFSFEQLVQKIEEACHAFA